jgi:hypothetical protein
MIYWHVRFTLTAGMQRYIRKNGGKASTTLEVLDSRQPDLSNQLTAGARTLKQVSDTGIRYCFTGSNGTRSLWTLLHVAGFIDS